MRCSNVKKWGHRHNFAWAALFVIGGLSVGRGAESDDGRLAPGNVKKPLVVCAVAGGMPRMDRAEDGSAIGIDLAVAELVAAELGRKLEVHWCASAACSWNCVRNRKCDLVAGQPHGSANSPEITWSVPYSGSRFGLVLQRDTQGIRTAADLNNKRVGVVTGSVAISAKGHVAVGFKSNEELLDGFVSSQLDAALIDDDFAAWYLHQHPDLPLRRVAEYVPRERWNTGFAVRTADRDLLRQVDTALRQLLSNGRISQAFVAQGISYRAPAVESAEQAESNSWKRIQEKGELAVSFDPANLPYSSADASRPGFDVQLALELAGELGLKLSLNWIDIHRETAIGQLLSGKCDLAWGAAIEPKAIDDEEELVGRVIYSQPYYGTGYFLVARRASPGVKSLTELQGEKSRRIGAEAGSIADYRLRQQGYLRRLFRTQLSALKALDDGVIDYAYLWGNVGWTLHTSNFGVEFVPDYVPEDHWNIAVAMRRGDAELKQRVDAALEQLVAAGTVAQALTDYHVPYLPPFSAEDAAESASLGNAELEKEVSGDRNVSGDRDVSGVIRHAPTDRGLEPQMQRRQRSKQRYTGLERVRAAGTLVVGLDQNALPFSAAHPQPAGLDFEIAGLLAEKLGVERRIYWAYSSHDSYPSKLANKELCDVMLGVMPDDRFGNRVTYSQPYYYSDYRFVVPVDAETPEKRTPLAVERGLAVRGIDEWQVHPYPSLASILEAVASGREQAGYVTSARGAWLAENRWPGKLTFAVNDSPNVDRFPICAAVRKTDGDLATAMDRAFEELAQSGELGAVFDRWHIPYTAPEATEQPTAAGRP